MFEKNSKIRIPCFKDQFQFFFSLIRFTYIIKALCKSLKIVFCHSSFFIRTKITCSFAFKQKNIEKNIYYCSFSIQRTEGGWVVGQICLQIIRFFVFFEG